MMRKSFFINTAMSISNQIITIICGLILPRLFLLYYGSAVNGLISSITQFLSFVTFMEMGIGAVVQSNLYKPLANGDKFLLSKIIISARNFYKIIARVFFIYIVVLCFLYPLTVKRSFDFVFTASLVVIISISMLMQYYFGNVNQILLNSDQRAYIPLFLQSFTLILNTLACYLLMIQGNGIQIVKLGTAIIYLLRPFFMFRYVRKNYDIDYLIRFKEEPIKQKWNGVAQHLAAMVLEHTDVIVLTLFATLESVSIYMVYYNVVCGIRRIFSTVIDSLRATFGKFIAENDKEVLDKYFRIMEHIVHFTIAVIFSCTYTLIVPFVKIYTDGIDDTNYILPVFGVLITSAYLFYCLRCFYNMPVLAAGCFKENQKVSFFECAINLIISIVFVNCFGLIGVALGTLCAMIYRVVYLIWYLSNKILFRKIFIAIRYIITDLVIILLSMLLTSPFKLYGISYCWWFILAIEKLLICVFTTFVIHYILYHSETVRIINIIIKKRTVK